MITIGVTFDLNVWCNNCEEVQFQLIADIELLLISVIRILFIPKFHSGLIILNQFMVINSCSDNPIYQFSLFIFNHLSK